MAAPSLLQSRVASLQSTVTGAMRDLTHQLTRYPSIAETEARAEQLRVAFHAFLADELRQMNQKSSILGSLPSETIGLIFSHLEHKDRLLAASVCSHWHNIVLTTPSLWTDIAVSLRPNSMYHEFLEEWLARSRTLPVSLSVADTQPKTWSPRSPSLPEELPHCITDHLEHMSHLYVSCMHSGLRLTSLIRPAPLLRSLTLHTRKMRYYLQRIPDGLFGAVTPNLMFVDIRGFGLPRPGVQFLSVKHLQISAIAPIDHDSPLHLMCQVALTFPNVVRLCLGDGHVPAWADELHRLRRATGLEEIIVTGNDQIPLPRARLRLEAVPRLVFYNQNETQYLLQHSMSTMHFFARSMEGREDDGRVVNVDWAPHRLRLRHVYNFNVRVAVFHVDHFRHSMELEWPLLETLEVDITRPRPYTVGKAFNLRKHQQWSVPALHTMRIVFTKDARGRGRRVVSVTELVGLLGHFFFEPVLATLDLVNLRLQKTSPVLDALVTTLLVDGAAYTEPSDDELAGMLPLIPPVESPNAITPSAESSAPGSPIPASSPDLDEANALGLTGSPPGDAEQHSSTASSDNYSDRSSSSADDSDSDSHESDSAVMTEDEWSSSSSASTPSSEHSWGRRSPVFMPAGASTQPLGGAEWRFVTSDFPASKIAKLIEEPEYRRYCMITAWRRTESDYRHR